MVNNYGGHVLQCILWIRSWRHFLQRPPPRPPPSAAAGRRCSNKDPFISSPLFHLSSSISSLSLSAAFFHFLPTARLIVSVFFNISVIWTASALIPLFHTYWCFSDKGMDFITELEFFLDLNSVSEAFVLLQNNDKWLDLSNIQKRRRKKILCQ